MRPGRWGPPSLRREIALALASTAVALLVVRALRLDAPLGISLSLARKNWSAGTLTRTLNSPQYARHVDLAKAALEADRQIPGSEDVALVLPPGTDPVAGFEQWKRTASLLVPRRVRVVTLPLPEGRGALLVPWSALPEAVRERAEP